MKRIQQLISLVRHYYNSSDPAHDWAHVGRVAATALKLSENLNVNADCVLASVYCHDLINLPKDHPDRSNASSLAAKEATPMLKKCGFTESEITTIQQAIIEHSFSKGLRPTTLEAKIVQDADRLDAIGAIGILRCAAVNAQMKSSFYDPFDPLAQDRQFDDKNFMLDHYFVKLFKLPELMNLPEAKAIAEQRVLFMKNFLQELMTEIRT
jgi:uncharacterized protein